MSDKPCVVLISPGIIKWTDMDFGLPHLVSIGGYIQEHVDVRIEILDLNYEGGDWHHLRRRLESLEPILFIGLSCYSSYDYMRVMTLAGYLQELYPDKPLVSGGYHASALPGDLIYDGSPFDAVVPGEGEVPMRNITETLLGGGTVEQEVFRKGVVEELDELPPYRWDLLDRYWPRAQSIGRKFQIYLARGCVYQCTFCMERAKSGYQWRSFSPDRAVAELERLSEFTDLENWIVNIADPLFGFHRSWRREVLEGIIEKELIPRKYWTLTRSDDLHDVDVQLFADANFSIGIGMESGSPQMLQWMQKGNKPDAYLDAQLRLARLSRKHGLNWAGNIIVGHPGETMETMRETRDFVYELFTSASETCGWVSFDPFRLYPGSHVQENMEEYAEKFGTTFYHPEWWKSWYDGPFKAQHIDPSEEVDFETRVNFMYENYAPLVREVLENFRSDNSGADRIYRQSMQEQIELISDETRESLLERARRAERRLDGEERGPSERFEATSIPVPIGLRIEDERVRKRERAVRRLLERGLLRTERLIEAFLEVPAADYLGEEGAEQFFAGHHHEPNREGAPPEWVGIDTCAVAFEAINPGPGDRVADLLSNRGYVAALFSEMVGPSGEVVAVRPGSWVGSFGLKAAMRSRDNVSVTSGTATTDRGLEGTFDAIWLGGAVPRVPGSFEERLSDPEGRMATFVGPRFREQDLVCINRRDGETTERVLGRVQAPVLAGPNGWLDVPRTTVAAE